MPSKLSELRDVLPVESWLLVGACIQAVAVLATGQIALVATGIVLLYRITSFVLVDQGILPSKTATNVRFGRWGAQLPLKDGTPSTGPGEEQVTIFMIGAQSNHPRGRFAPGFKELGARFKDMFTQLSRDAETTGLLGKTPTLVSQEADSNNTLFWVSYWRDLESLQAFADGPLHADGMQWFRTIVNKQYRHIAIFHETYTVPKGNWETIAVNSRPFGLGNTTTFIKDASTKSLTPISVLSPADEGERWQRMASRMGTRLAD